MLQVTIWFYACYHFSFLLSLYFASALASACWVFCPAVYLTHFPFVLHQSLCHYPDFSALFLSSIFCFLQIYMSLSLSLFLYIYTYTCARAYPRAHTNTHIFVDDLTSPVPTIFLLECKLLREITCLFYSLPYLQLLEQYLTSDRCSQILNELIKKLISLFSVYCKYNTVQSG